MCSIPDLNYEGIQIEDSHIFIFYESLKEELNIGLAFIGMVVLIYAIRIGLKKRKKVDLEFLGLLQTQLYSLP